MSPALRAEVTKLKKNLESLADSFDTNSKVFSEGLLYTDALLWILRAAMNDMVNLRLHTIEAGDSKMVDLQYYWETYRTHITPAPEDPAEGLIKRAGLDTIVFGGT